MCKTVALPVSWGRSATFGSVLALALQSGSSDPPVHANNVASRTRSCSSSVAETISLGLAPDYFAHRYAGYTADPLILFRIFQYPSRPVPADVGALYGVGEHTDYGLLTLLRQDAVGVPAANSLRATARIPAEDFDVTA